MALGVAPWACAQSHVTTAPAPEHSLTDRYCVFCHNQKLKTGGVSLEGIDAAHVSGNAAVLEKVLRKIRTGEMPPPGLPRPGASESAAFSASIESALDRQAAADPNPGRPVIHRLNRAEYSNAVRDLLAVDIDAGATLPVDDSGYGFDNIGAVLSLSPTLFERYMSAARMVSRLAVGDLGMKSRQDEFVCRARRKERAGDDLPFDSRGGLDISYYFPLDAEYVIRVKLTGEDGGASYQLRLPVKAGLRSLGATFLRDAEEPEVAIPLARGAGQTEASRPEGLSLRAVMDLRLDGARLKRFEVPEGAAMPQIDKLIVSGPYNATGPGDTLSRQKIFVCRPPADGKDDEPCARLVLSVLARRAFRRPVTDADLKPLMAFYQTDASTAISIAASRRRFAPCWFPRISCSALSVIRPMRRRARCTGSAIWSWLPGSPFSCGAALPTIGCSIWPKRAGCAIPRCWPAKCAACSTTRVRRRSSPTSPGSGSTSAIWPP